MLIFKDIISNDEMFTDTYKYEACPEFENAVYKVVGKLTTESYGIDDAAIGGNASAEGDGGDEGADPSAVSGINIVLVNRLQPVVGFNKVSFKSYIKDYMKAILAKLEERDASKDEVKNFQKGCSAFVKAILGKFDDWEFFNGESMNPDGMVVFLRWEDQESGDEAPCLYFIKAGLEEEKA